MNKGDLYSALTTAMQHNEFHNSYVQNENRTLENQKEQHKN